MNRSVAEPAVDVAAAIYYVDRFDRYKVTPRVGGGEKHVKLVATEVG